MKKRNLRLGLLFGILIGWPFHAEAQAPCGSDMTPLFGLTTESVEDLDGRLLPALEKIREKCIPTLRVVFQPADNSGAEEELLNEYAEKLERIRGKGATPTYAYVMGLLVDSQAFYKYDNARMRERARKYAEALGDYVDIWEAGNEVNGDWVGWNEEEKDEKGEKKYEKEGDGSLKRMRESVGKRIKIVYDEVRKVYGKKGKTPRFALNLYFNDDNIESRKKSDGSYDGNNCLNMDLKKCRGDCLHDYEMFTWADKYLKPRKNKLKFDYVLFSFYKDDCSAVVTDAQLWARTFAKLSADFTVEGVSPKVGFGEVGPQCYCSVDGDGKPKKDGNLRRVDPCCRPEQPSYVRDYYQTLHRQIKAAINDIPGRKPDYVGGFFYWYFYQDATEKKPESEQVLNALVESAETWRKQ